MSALPTDKAKHLFAGAVLALVLLLVWAAQVALAPALVAQWPWAFATFNGAVLGSVVKEAADWLDNRTSPGLHEVSVWDALAGAAGSAAVLALVIGLVLAQAGAPQP